MRKRKDSSACGALATRMVDIRPASVGELAQGTMDSDVTVP